LCTLKKPQIACHRSRRRHRHEYSQQCHDVRVISRSRFSEAGGLFNANILSHVGHSVLRIQSHIKLNNGTIYQRAPQADGGTSGREKTLCSREKSYRRGKATALITLLYRAAFPCHLAAREAPAREGDIPHGAVALKEAAVVGDGTTHRKATGWANQEGHRSLAGRRIVGGRERKGRCCTVCFYAPNPRLACKLLR
jgi:hypothetical protein